MSGHPVYGTSFINLINKKFNRDCEIGMLKTPNSNSAFFQFLSEISDQINNKCILGQIYFHIIFEIICVWEF